VNVIKHMEAAFIVALGLAAAGSVAVDSVKPAQGIPVVHVTAKRLTPVQKLQMLALERVRSRA